MNSVSRYALVLEIRGGPKIRVDLKRHLSPRTVAAILRLLPVQGNAHFVGKSMVHLGMRVNLGAERVRAEFKKGDVAFSPADGGICFFVVGARPGRQMSIIGRIVGRTEDLARAKPGDVLLLYQDDSGGGDDDDDGGGGGDDAGTAGPDAAPGAES